MLSKIKRSSWYRLTPSSDIIFCHNEHDEKWYKGMYPDKPTFPLMSLMIEDSIKNDKLKITKLAQGLPVGGEIEQLDDGTLFSAFKHRVPVSEEG